MFTYSCQMGPIQKIILTDEDVMKDDPNCTCTQMITRLTAATRPLKLLSVLLIYFLS